MAGTLFNSMAQVIIGGRSMKWGKDPDNRTPFGIWLDQEGIFQTEVAKASGLSESVISMMCNKDIYRPSYLIFRKIKVGLAKLGYTDIKYDFWSSDYRLSRKKN
jgi:hypothetical protein